MRKHYWNPLLQKSSGQGGVGVITTFWRGPGTFQKEIRQMKLQTGPFKKEHVKPSFRHSVNFSQTVVVQNEVLLHWCLAPRPSLDGWRLEQVQYPGRHCTGKHTESHLWSPQPSTSRFPVAPAAAWSIQDPTQSCCSFSDYRNSFKTAKLLISQHRYYLKKT